MSCYSTLLSFLLYFIVEPRTRKISPYNLQSNLLCQGVFLEYHLPLAGINMTPTVFIDGFNLKLCFVLFYFFLYQAQVEHERKALDLLTNLEVFARLSLSQTHSQ